MLTIIIVDLTIVGPSTLCVGEPSPLRHLIAELSTSPDQVAHLILMHATVALNNDIVFLKLELFLRDLQSLFQNIFMDNNRRSF